MKDKNNCLRHQKHLNLKKILNSKLISIYLMAQAEITMSSFDLLALLQVSKG